MFDKYLYALGRGVRGAKQALDEARARETDPARDARDVTPPDAAQSAPPSRPARPGPDIIDATLARAPLVLGKRALVMGIVNVTPDSLSDGGQFFDPAAAIAHALTLVREGADILDIGGESTRPGAQPVDEAEELGRVIPVIRAIAAQTSTPISIDTMKANVARAAISAGATILNDVWGFQRDPEMARVAAECGVHCVLMHNRAGDDPGADMFAEVKAFLARSAELALSAGIAREKIILDPGIGFGKTPAQGYELIRRLGELKSVLGFPLLLGVSRKRLIGAATGRTVASERLAGSLAAALYGAMRGVDILRVHDVAAHVDAVKMLAAIDSAAAGKHS